MLHHTTRPYTARHDTTLHCTALHYTRLHYTTLNYTTLHYATLYYAKSHYTTAHHTTQHDTALHTLRRAALHCTAPRHTTRQDTTRRYTTTALHYAMPRYNYHYHYRYNYNYTTTTTPLRYFTAITTTITTLQYNYSALRPAVVHPVTTATTPQSTAPTTFRSISGFGLPSQQLTSPIGFLSLKLPPLPCSVLLMILMQIAGDKNGVCMFVREFLMVWILSTPPQVVPKWLTGYGAVA